MRSRKKTSLSPLAALLLSPAAHGRVTFLQLLDDRIWNLFQPFQTQPGPAQTNPHASSLNRTPPLDSTLFEQDVRASDIDGIDLAAVLSATTPHSPRDLPHQPLLDQPRSPQRPSAEHPARKHPSQRPPRTPHPKRRHPRIDRLRNTLLRSASAAHRFLRDPFVSLACLWIRTILHQVANWLTRFWTNSSRASSPSVPVRSPRSLTRSPQTKDNRDNPANRAELWRGSG
ncbi:MAG: hypothetical protein U0903_08355 [Planctomycetales bacterium]